MDGGERPAGFGHADDARGMNPPLPVQMQDWNEDNNKPHPLLPGEHGEGEGGTTQDHSQWMKTVGRRDGTAPEATCCIFVRASVFATFSSILDESGMDSNLLMEKFFGLYKSHVNFVQEDSSETTPQLFSDAEEKKVSPRGERNFRCKECSAVFKLKFHLNRHFKRVHLAEQKRLRRESLSLRNTPPDSSNTSEKMAASRERTSPRSRLETPNVKSGESDEEMSSNHDNNKDSENSPEVKTEPDFGEEEDENYDNDGNDEGGDDDNDNNGGNDNELSFWNGEEFECQFCGYKNLRKHYMDQHLRSHTGEKPFKCHLCDSAFTQKGNLGRHHKRVHFSQKETEIAVDGMIISCANGEMKGVVPSEKSGDDTENTSVGAPPEPAFKCALCNATFISRDFLSRHHQMCHIRESFIQCNKCLMVFKAKEALEEHLNSTDGCPGGKKKKCSECQICGYKGRCWADLKIHNRMHTGERPYKCVICEVAFAQNCHLMQHYRKIHPTAQRFPCPLCGKTFWLESQLLEHQQTGLGCKAKEKEMGPWPCGTCEKVFVNKEKLRMHRRTHEAKPTVRSHLCDTCGKTFTSKRLVLKHKIIHADEKPFGCEQCEYRTKHKYNLSIHKLRHKCVKPYICEHCGKGFKRTYHLKRHTSLLHSGHAQSGRQDSGGGTDGYQRSGDDVQKTYDGGEGLKTYDGDHGQKTYDGVDGQKPFDGGNVLRTYDGSGGQKTYDGDHGQKTYDGGDRQRTYDQQAHDSAHEQLGSSLLPPEEQAIESVHSRQDIALMMNNIVYQSL